MLASLLLIIVACSKDPDPSPSGGGGSNGGSAPSAPTGVSATVSGSQIYVSWNPVSNADYYELFYSTDGSSYESGLVRETEAYISAGEGTLSNGDYYFKIKAFNNYGSSPYSSIAHCYFSSGGNGGGGGGSTTISAPTNVSANVSGSQVRVSWNSVSNASYYRVYRASSSSGSYSMLERAYGTYYYDSNPNTDNYYKVTAVSNSGDESNKSDYAYCYYSSGGGGGTTVPDAPTGVEAHDNSVVGETWVLISWNSVSNATSYKVYRSSSANGSYSLITTTEYTSYNDRNPMNGSNYYKVKAVNSAGESSYSSYAYYNNTPTVYSPCPVTYTSHTASSYQITLRWTNPTTFGCGTPTTAYLRVRHPETGDYVTLETLSGSASSASFSYGMWANSEGYVYCGIITENSSGTSGGVPLVYNWKTDTWYGGKGLEMTEEMEKEWKKFS